MKKIITTTIVTLTLALSGVAFAYTPTREQCAAAGAGFNTATQGCDFAAPLTAARTSRAIVAVPGTTYQVFAGDTVSYGGTTVYVTSPGTVTFCPCPGWE